jgi:hypothetical protein
MGAARTMLTSDLKPAAPGRRSLRTLVLRTLLLVAALVVCASMYFVGYVQAFAHASRNMTWAPADRGAPVLLRVKAPPELFVGVISHPGNVMRRELFRRTCAPKYRAAGIGTRIFVGRPSEDTGRIESWQGMHATSKEIELSRALLNESIVYGDMVISATRDHYRDLTDKVIKMYQYGVRTGAAYIAKNDDGEFA